jgi:hypothetical protein
MCPPEIEMGKGSTCAYLRLQKANEVGIAMDRRVVARGSPRGEKRRKTFQQKEWFSNCGYTYCCFRLQVEFCGAIF